MIERRFNSVPVTAKDKRIEGIASCFYNGNSDTEYELWEGAFERMHSGSFDIESDIEVVALYNHSDLYPLARKSEGSLSLSLSDRGLHYSFKPNGTSYAKDLLINIADRTIKGSSFAMLPTDVEWTTENRNGKTVDIRNIKKVSLHDVSCVTSPAYSGSGVGLRSQNLQDIKTEFRIHKANLQNEKRLQHIEKLKATL